MISGTVLFPFAHFLLAQGRQKPTKQYQHLNRFKTVNLAVCQERRVTRPELLFKSAEIKKAHLKETILPLNSLLSFL